MKGRSSFTVTIRLRDEIRPELERRAALKNMTIGQYITDCINHSVHQEVHTINPVTNPPTNNPIHSVHTIKSAYDPGKHSLTMQLPIYDPAIHKPGDKVRIKSYNWWKAIIVPELDADGHTI